MSRSQAFFTEERANGFIVTGVALDSPDAFQPELIVPTTLNGRPVVGIGRDAFAWNYSLKVIVVGEGVEEIDSWAFWDCPWLEKAVVPQSVKRINSWAFGGCPSLTQISLPEGIEKLGDSIFSGCASLKSVAIPKSVKEIGEDAFENCAATLRVYENSYAERWALLNGKKYELFDRAARLFIVEEQSGGLVVTGVNRSLVGSYAELITPQFINGKPVVAIGSKAFVGCDCITRLVISEGVESIGELAFARCAAITEIVVPPSVRRIGAGAFARCFSLESLNLHENITEIGEGAFDFCPVKPTTTIVHTNGDDRNHSAEAKSDSINVVPTDTLQLIDTSAEIGLLSDDDTDNGSEELESQEQEQLETELLPYDTSEAWRVDTVHDFNLANWQTEHGSENNDAEETWNVYKYKRTPRGIVITGLIESETLVFSELIIPGKIKDQKVVAIGDDAFYDVKSLKRVAIAEGIEEIGLHAFSDSEGLSHVALPRTLKRIDAEAFDSCSSLERVILHNGLEEIGDDAFCATGIKNVAVPKTVKKIGKGAFSFTGASIKVDQTNQYYCSHNGALFDRGKKRLLHYPAIDSKPLTIPNGVEIIEECAFSGNYPQDVITIPSTVTSICSKAFTWSGCKVEVNAKNQRYSSHDGALFDKKQRTLLYFPSKVLRKLYEIPASVVKLEEDCFLGNNTLKEVILRNSIQEIASSAFSCSAIECIRIPSSVKQLVSFVFSSCSNLSKVTLEEGVERIENYAFSWCRSLQKLTIPQSVIHIGANAFDNCPVTLFVYEGSYAENWARKHASKYQVLKSPRSTSNGVPTPGTRGSYVPLPPRQTSARSQQSGSHTQRDAKAPVSQRPSNRPNHVDVIRSVTGRGGFTQSVKETPADYFIYEDTEQGIVLTGIDKNRSLDNDSLRIPRSISGRNVVAIGVFAFAFCSTFSHVAIPSNIKVIGNNAFYHCDQLSSVEIENGVEIIGFDAFTFCTQLKEIFIPNSIQEINPGSFDMTSVILKIAPNHPRYNVYDNILFDRLKRSIVRFPQKSAITNYTIPSGILTIEPGSFKYCSSLNNVVVPESVKDIGIDAFQFCGGTINVDPRNADFSSIDGILFDKLQRVLCHFPNEYRQSFYYVPDTVNCIVDYAFAGCSLSEITIPYGVRKIGEGAFQFCDSLTHIDFPPTVKEMSDGMFACCCQLSEINIPEGVKFIGRNVFDYCPALPIVILPQSITVIDKEAFDECSALLVVHPGSYAEQWMRMNRRDYDTLW